MTHDRNIRLPLPGTAGLASPHEGRCCRLRRAGHRALGTRGDARTQWPVPGHALRLAVRFHVSRAARADAPVAWHRKAFLLAAPALLPADAWAHSQIQGMGEFSGGLIHPILTPTHLLILLALGLWLGQQRPLRLRMPMALFVLGSGAGLLLSLRFPLPTLLQPWLAALALAFALLVVTAARFPAQAAPPLFALGALVIGLDSAVEGAAPAKAAMTLLGTWLSVNLCVLNFAYYVSLCPQRQWVQTGIRVAGSWIAAICLLVLAFSLKA